MQLGRLRAPAPVALPATGCSYLDVPWLLLLALVVALPLVAAGVAALTTAPMPASALVAGVTRRGAPARARRLALLQLPVRQARRERSSARGRRRRPERRPVAGHHQVASASTRSRCDRSSSRSGA